MVLRSSRLILVLLSALALVAALACGGAEEETGTTTTAPADTGASTTQQTAAPTAAPAVAQPVATQVPLQQAAEVKEEQAPKPALATKEVAMEDAKDDFQYVPEPQLPGVYWDYKYTGPRPTEFGENPRFAEMVKAGQLPPVEERLPEEIKVVSPPDGIGDYGGTRRVTWSGGASAWMSWYYWDKKNSNEVEHLPHVGFFEISEDGRTYTFRNRKGLKWSDGTPMTMEDVRFAWEDVNLNTVLHETPQTQWLDSVTGNIVKFAVVDDLHWTLTFDSPDYILMEGEVRPGSNCTSFYYCFYSPSHYMKQFHQDYADADQLAKLIEDAEAGDWPRFWGQMNNYGTHVNWPWMGHWTLASESDTLYTMDANPFFFEVDPHGNQLPYNDGVQIIKVESREVAVFRSMAGETDIQGRDFLVSEIPLYRSNQDKGNFSIKIWPTTGPGDIAMSICITCNQDAELGKLIRTNDFRRALSFAVDREGMNDSLYLGLGIPNNWVPHPAVQYYPGEEYAFKDIEYDPDKANEILDSLGYTERDAEGFRMRADGSGERLSFRTVSELGQTGDAAQLMLDYWAEVGVEFKDKNMNAPWTLSYPGKEPLAILRHFSLYGANPWFSSWTRCCATGGGPAFSPDISDLPRSMQRGPQGAVPTEGGYQPRCDCEMAPVWEPTAPADTYPADPSGNVGILHDSWHEGRGIPALSPERIELGKNIFRIHADEKYYLSVVSHMGYMRGIILHQNNHLNVPETHTSDTGGWYNELFYFPGGQDNIQ